MANTCVKCRAQLADGQAFCTSCGTRRGSVAPTSPATLKPESAVAGSLRKIAALALGLFAVVILLVLGGSAYVAYRAKNKISAIEKTLKTRGIAAATSAGAVPPGPAESSNPPGTTAGSSNAGAAPIPNESGAAPLPEVGSGALVTSPATSATPASLPTPTPILVTGEQVKNWAKKYERTEGGLEADLVVRTGDINNLGFGWNPGFDPFSGKSTPPHFFPWTPPTGAPEGTDRIMIASIVTPMDVYKRRNDGYSSHDGYSETLLRPCCAVPVPNAPPTQPRLDSMPRPITLTLGALPAKIDAVVFQIFVDDFQPMHLHSHFQITVNGTRIPQFEEAINALDQTGPIGKLLTLRLLPEYWPLLQSGTVKLFIDDPTTQIPDGFAIDFVRILVNPHEFKYSVAIAASVVDADKNTPISSATVSAALGTATTDNLGQCQLTGLPAGLVVASAIAPGYDSDSVSVDLVGGQTGKAVFKLHKHDEGTAALERSIAQTGSATVYGIHFDTDSAKLRPDSEPALASILGLINDKPGSRWIISGHTDNQGATETNLKLSEARAASVVSWLNAHGVAVSRLEPKGFGASRPVADNAAANGRALNRRVEIALAK